ncbi:MAG: hypothetical protein ABH879_04985 [archaeon]
MKSEAHEDGLADYAMSLDPTDRRPLDEVACGFYRDYILYAEAKILHDEVPESQEWYLRNARTKPGGTIVIVPQKGTYYNSLYQRHQNLKRSKDEPIRRNRPDDVFDWIRSVAQDDALHNRAMDLAGLYSNRQNGHSSQELAAIALDELSIPTDARSLSRFVGLFDGDVNDLVDLVYNINPFAVQALERKKVGRQAVTDYLREHLTGDSGRTSSSNGGGTAPVVVLTSITPYQTYQQEKTVRSQLLDLSLRAHSVMPFDYAMNQINSLAFLHPGNDVLREVLTETRVYLEMARALPDPVTRVGV